MGILHLIYDNFFEEPEPIEIEESSKDSREEESRKIEPDIDILNNFIGQKHIIDLIKNQIVGSILNEKPIPHFLLGGYAGYGKTTLARAISECIGSNCTVVTGPNVTLEELENILFSSQDYDIIFIDEIHSMKYKAQEILYEAMQDFMINGVEIGKAIVIGATTRPNALNKPLRDRFLLNFLMKPYSDDELIRIIKKHHSNISDKFAQEIANRSKGIPRKAKNFATIVSNEITTRISVEKKEVDDSLIKNVFKKLGVEFDGLDEKDLFYLSVLNGDKPRSLGHVSKALQQKGDDIEFGIEPYLISKKLVDVTPRGRILTKEGVDRLNGISKLVTE
jgi:Holliday junction DNA helicase RuvB